MAARRLVIVMLVLLALSTLVAALVPAPDRGGNATRSATGPSGPTSTSQAPVIAPQPAAVPGLVEARIDIAPKPAGPPPVVAVEPGNRLVLGVGGTVGNDISIPAFGLTETMTPSAAAIFDLIVDRPGRFAVRAFGADRVVGTIVSKKRAG